MMTSSPGSTPITLSEMNSAAVPLQVARQSFAPVTRAYSRSNFFTFCPLPRNHFPLCRTSIRARSSASPDTGHAGKGSVRTLEPPSRAGLPASAAEACRTTPAAEAPVRKPRRLKWDFIPTPFPGPRGNRDSMSTAGGKHVAVHESWQRRLHIQPEFFHAAAVHVTQELVQVPLVEIHGGDGGGAPILCHREHLSVRVHDVRRVIVAGCHQKDLVFDGASLCQCLVSAPDRHQDYLRPLGCQRARRVGIEDAVG